MPAVYLIKVLIMFKIIFKTTREPLFNFTVLFSLLTLNSLIHQSIVSAGSLKMLGRIIADTTRVFENFSKK